MHLHGIFCILLASIFGAYALDYAQVPANGTLLPTLYWGACWIQGNTLGVFGGVTDPTISSQSSTRYQSALHLLDLDTFQWSNGTSNAYTLVNIGNAVVTVGNTVYIWAGSTIQGTAPGGSTLTRSSAFTTYDTVAGNWSFTPNPLLPPFSTTPRGLANAVVTPRGGIAVFGGSQGTNPFFNDFYEFNITAQTWTNLNTPGDPNIPAARSGVSSVVYKGIYYTFGGRIATSTFNDVHSYDFDTGLWSVVNTTGTPPSPRFDVPSGLASDGTWLFFGGTGSQANSWFGDTFYLDLNTFTWSSPQVAVSPPARGYSCGTQKGNTFYIFGGATSSAAYNDVWTYTYVPPAPPTSATSVSDVSVSGGPTGSGTVTGAANNTASGSDSLSSETASTYSTEIVADATKVAVGLALLALLCF